MPQMLDRAGARSRGAIVAIDVRATDVVEELATTQWEHTRAVARMRRAAAGTRVAAEAAQQVRELAEAIRQLRRSLAERPWTET